MIAADTCLRRAAILIILLLLVCCDHSNAWLRVQDQHAAELEMPVRPRYVSEHVAVHQHEGDELPGLFGRAFHEIGPISAEYVYTGELFTNARGGIRTADATRYLGLFPGRDQDTVGAGMARVLLNFGGTGRENAIECFYKMHLSDHVMIQPDLQYIASPSGLYRDALVAGVRFELVL